MGTLSDTSALIKIMHSVHNRLHEFILLARRGCLPALLFIEKK